MNNKILFITTTNLSVNPRLLKETELALNNGFETSMIGFSLGNWSDKTESVHLRRMPELKTVYLSANKNKFVPWFISTIVWKICQFVTNWFSGALKVNAFAHNKRTWLIGNYLNRLDKKFSLIVAHNLGALYPAYVYSKKHNIPFAFDIEDYHPGEKCSDAERRRREFLMQRLLPHAAYISFASPLIGENSLKLLPPGNIPPHFLVNNCFGRDEFQLAENNSSEVKFVWFSQNISAGRGLELLLPALYKFKDKVKLVLIGNLYSSFYSDFLSGFSEVLQIYEPLPQDDLNRLVCHFDVGLAIELKSADLNRDICLTNKIFTYAQAGLYILATNTSAQELFMSEHRELGEVSGQTPQEMEKVIKDIIENIDTIRKNKRNRFEYAKKLSWENDGEKLLKAWKEII